MAKIASPVGYYDIQIVDYPIPEPMDDGVVVKVDAAAICGSDRGIIDFKEHHMAGVMGHEFCGRVVSMGKDAKKSIHCYGGELEIGDRIVVYPHITCGHCAGCLRYGPGVCGACTEEFFYGGGWDYEGDPSVTEIYNLDVSKWPHFKGGFAEYVYIFPGTYVWKVPNDMPSEIAALLDPLAVAVRAIEQGMTTMGSIEEGLSTSSTALIVGAGAIGVMAGMILKHMGVSTLIFSDMKAKKLALAQEIAGADIVLNVAGMTSEERVSKVLELTRGGADFVINCANHPASQVEALQMVHFMGYYVEVGNTGYAGDDPYMANVNLTNLIFNRNIHVTGLVANSNKTFDRSFRLLKKHNEIPFHKLITHKFQTLEELVPTLKKMGDDDYLKGVWIPEE